jgi:hypothetical protein
MDMVAVNEENVASCMCSECPVQMNSKCAQAKGDDAKLYCAKGVSACKDLDESQMCICSTCPVFKKNGLSNCKWTYKFCFKGKAVKK